MSEPPLHRAQVLAIVSIMVVLGMMVGVVMELRAHSEHLARMGEQLNRIEQAIEDAKQP